MLYVVNADIEIDAETPELAEDAVVEMFEKVDKDIYVSILEVVEG